MVILEIFRLKCFNPCFRGTCSWCISGLTSPEVAIRFNPCFRGTCSWCFVILCFLLRVVMFQSLFSWNLLLMFEFLGGSSYSLLRVSILVFVELALDAAELFCPRVYSLCFNPCFRGTCSWCFLGVAWDGHIPCVSILVFVELALDE